jgi:hypothetical protein
MKIVFIAGPLVSGWDWKDEKFIDGRVKEAEKYQIALINSGVGCFCPHTHTSFHHRKGSTAPEKFYHDMDFEFLKRCCGAVLAMPGWEKSKGAKNEVEWAKANRLTVFYPKSPEDIKDIIEWNKGEV